MDNNEAIRKGFNAGYLMEKHHPALSKKLREGLTNQDDPYALGFVKGSQEYAQEALFESGVDFAGETLIDRQIDNPERDLEKDSEGKGLDVDI